MNDTSGFKNNGTGLNITWNASGGVHGGAIYFNGSAKVTVPTPAALNISNSSHTITYWVKYNTTLQSTFILLTRNDGGGYVHSYTLGGGSIGHSTYTGSSGWNSNSPLAYNDNRWHFVFQQQNIVLNKTYLYIDNILVSEGTDGIGTNLYPYTLYFGSQGTSNNLTGYLDEINIYNYALNDTERNGLFNQFQPVLTYPGNELIVSGSYPPLITTVNFSWINTETASSEIIVARDSNFNLISIDEFTSNDYFPFPLESGTYYWKVRQYNTTTSLYENTSATQNFTVSLVNPATGYGINGVVHEIINGVETPIDLATVYIYNNTWSNSQVTGSNGYYLFSGLSNGTYNVYAVKNGYDSTAAFPVTVNGSITTNDILMKIYISPYVPNFVFEKFIVRDMFDNSYVGVTATVYKGDSLISSFTGTTDSTGSVVFQLIKDQRYRVTFSGGGISDMITIYVYAKEESYFVRVLTGFPTGGDRYIDISTNLTPIFINASWSNLSLIYSDSRLSTSIIWFYATNMSTGVTCYASVSGSNSSTLGCAVLSTGLYQFGFNATSSIYGFFQEDKVINFGAGTQAASILNTKADRTLLQWGSIALIVFVAALFSQKSVKYGAVVVPFVAFALWMPPLSTFEPIVGGSAETNFTLLSCALVMGVMIYLRMSENKSAVSI